MVHYVDLLHWEHDIRRKFYFFSANFNTWMNVHLDAGQSVAYSNNESGCVLCPPVQGLEMLFSQL